MATLSLDKVLEMLNNGKMPDVSECSDITLPTDYDNGGGLTQDEAHHIYDTDEKVRKVTTALVLTLIGHPAFIALMLMCIEDGMESNTFSRIVVKYAVETAIKFIKEHGDELEDE